MPPPRRIGRADYWPIEQIEEYIAKRKAALQWLLSTKQAAQLLGLKVHSLREYRRLGISPPANKIDRRLYWAEAQIAELQAERQARERAWLAERQSLLNSDEVGRKIGYSRAHVLWLSKQGKLPPAVRKIWRRYYWQPEQAD